MHEIALIELLKQAADNGYIRLQAWCAEKGWSDPFASTSTAEAAA